MSSIVQFSLAAPTAEADQPAIANRQSAMSVDHAAAIMHLTCRQVQRMCETARLAARRVDGRWIIDPACDPRLSAAAHMDVPAAPAGSLLAGMSRAKRAVLASRYDAIQQFIAARAACPDGRQLTRWSAQWVEIRNARLSGPGRISLKTFRRWLKLFADEGIAGLADHRVHTGAITQCADMWEIFKDEYLSQNDPMIPRLWEHVAAIAQARGRPWPSLSTIQRWVRERLDPKQIAYGRDPKKFRDRCIPYMIRDWTRVPAMGCWVADHHECDVMLPHKVWSPKKKRMVWAWHRPWLTMYMDARTWKPTCWTIRFESPDGNIVMATLVRGIIAHGSPDVVYLDNGKDFRMRKFSGGRPRKDEGNIVDEHRVKPLLETLGIRPTFANPYNAKAKPIEPWFKLFAEWFSKTWETYIGNKPERRPEHFKELHGRAEEFARKGYTLESFRQAFNQWVTGDYCLRQSPARACGGLSVDRAFMEFRRPGFVPCRPSAQDLAVLLMPSESVKVAQNGVFVAAFGAYYYDPADAAQFAALEPRRCASGRDIKRHIRYSYDPLDSSRIFVFDAQTEKFLCFATPSPWNGQYPLASITGDQADKDRLSDGIEAAGHLRKLTAIQRQATRRYANVLLDGHRLGAQVLGLHDDQEIAPASPPILKLTHMSHVAQQATEHKERQVVVGRANESRRSFADRFFSAKPIVKEATTDRPAAGPDFNALDLLSGRTTTEGSNQQTTDGHGDQPCPIEDKPL